MTKRPRTSKRKRPEEELENRFHEEPLRRAEYLKGPGATLQKPAKRCPQATASLRTRSGDCSSCFSVPTHHSEARGGTRLRVISMPGGAPSGPKLRVGGETPAAMMARPSCRGHFTTQFSRRGAHDPAQPPQPPLRPPTVDRQESRDSPTLVPQPRPFGPQSPPRPAAES